MTISRYHFFDDEGAPGQKFLSDVILRDDPLMTSLHGGEGGGQKSDIK